MAFEALCEVVEEVSACLFEAIDAGVKTKNAICATFETTGLMNVYSWLLIFDPYRGTLVIKKNKL